MVLCYEHIEMKKIIATLKVKYDENYISDIIKKFMKYWCNNLFNYSVEGVKIEEASLKCTLIYILYIRIIYMINLTVIVYLLMVMNFFIYRLSL